MSPSLSTKVLLFSGISLLQISTNFVDLAQVSALTLTHRTGMSKCQEAHVLESFQEKSSDSEQNSEDLQQNHDPADAEAGAGNANSPSVCETRNPATGRTSSNSNEAGMSDSYAKMLESNAKVLQFMNTANLSVRERAYLLRKHLLIQDAKKTSFDSRASEPIDLSLNFVDAARLSVPEGTRQDAAFEIAEDGAQTSAASTLVRAQRLKTVGDLKTWLASVRGKSKFLIDVFLLGTEMQLEDTRTLSRIGDEFGITTGPVNLFVLERVSWKDALVQDFLKQYSTFLNNFPEIESFTADQVVQKNEVTVRIERADIDSINTKTSSDKDSSPFFEFTFVRERTSEKMPNETVDVWDKMYIVFRGRTDHVILYDVSDDKWWHQKEEDIICEDTTEDVSFKNNIGFLAHRMDFSHTDVPSCTLRITGLGEMTWARLFTMYLIFSSFESSTYDGDYSIFPDHAKELLIPEWEDFAIEFHNESAGAASLDREPIPDSQRLITKTDAGDVKIYDSDREYFEEVERKVGGNWNGLRIADVTFKQTQVFKQS